jgi:hypothetical protein
MGSFTVYLEQQVVEGATLEVQAGSPEEALETARRLALADDLAWEHYEALAPTLRLTLAESIPPSFPIVV